MEDNNEASALKKEIEFLTNLINGAGSTSVRHDTQPKNIHGNSATRHQTHWSSVPQSRHALVKPTPNTSSKYSLTRVPGSRPHNNHAVHPHVSVTGRPGTSHVYVKNNLNPSIAKSGVRLEPTQREKYKIPQSGSVNVVKSKIIEKPKTCVNPVIPASLQNAALKNETSSSSAPRRLVKLPSVSNLSIRNVHTQHVSNVRSTTSAKRTVCPPNSGIQKVASHKSEVWKGQLVRSASDTCLQSKARVVLPSQTQLKRSATSSTLAASGKADPPKNDTQKCNTMMSPTVIKAGKKIIEEIERLNRAMTQFEKRSQKNVHQEKAKSTARVPVEITKPLTTAHIPKSNASVPSGQSRERTVLPLGAGVKFAVPPRKEYNLASSHNALIKKDKYRVVKATGIQRVAASRSAPALLEAPSKTASDRVLLHLAQEGKLQKAHSVPSNTISLKPKQPSLPVVKDKSPYKLVRTTSGPNVQAQASPQVPRTKYTPRLNAKSPFKLTRVTTPQKNNYKLTRRNSLSRAGKSFVIHSPVASPRRRVYLTRRRLQNVTPQPLTKTDTVSTKELSGSELLKSNSSSALKSQTSQTSSIKAGQSDEVKSLLLELAIIDTAFKTAKLQSSQKLLKRALLTKQKMMQRKSAEKNTQGSTVVMSRHNRAKWTTPASRRPRLRSHSRSKSPSKSQKSWSSRFSLKKSSPGTDLNINQLLGRTVDNVSSNKYKFINRGASSNSSPQKYTHRLLRNVQSNKNRLKVDRRTPAQRAIGEAGLPPRRRRVGRQHVSIGGVVYKTSQRKLTRASPKRVVSKKGFPKPQTRRVSIGGHRYRVTQNRLTLLRVNSDKDGVRRLSLGGVKYIQTKPGTLVRATDSTSRTTASRFIYRSIATAAAAAAARNKKVSGTKRYCMFYNRFGKCNRGDKCPYLHDPDKVAVCTRFLRGTCKVTDCPFSHKVEPDKMPVCTHFLRGVCSRDQCPYRHVKVSSDAELCQDFVNGYCPLGDKCKKKHSRVCPKHDGKGACPDGTKCKLFHPRRGEKRAVESEHRPAIRKPRIKRADSLSSKDVEMHLADVEDRHLPLRERHLPSYISIRSEESAMDVSITAHDDISFSVDEPLQIRPNLSFDAS